MNTGPLTDVNPIILSALSFKVIILDQNAGALDQKRGAGCLSGDDTRHLIRQQYPSMLRNPYAAARGIYCLERLSPSVPF